MEEANSFISVKLKTAKTTAYAVFLCIASPIVLIILGAVSESEADLLTENLAGGIGMIVLFIFIAAAVAIFLSSAGQTAPFEYPEKEKFETEYGVSGMVKERREQYRSLHTKNNIAGSCLCIAPLIPFFIGIMIDANNDIFLVSMLSLSILIAGLGVIILTKTGIIWASYEKLLQEGEYSKENKEKASIGATISYLYWAIAIAVYLGYSLLTSNWRTTWTVLLVAAIIFPAIVSIGNLFDKKSK